jgi:hypothetical protein
MCPKDADYPFEIGCYLGQMKPEYPEHRILSFYSGGCKQYALKIENLKTGKIDHIFKCRGVTMDSQASEQFNHERFKQMINDYGNVHQNYISLKYKRFRPDWRYGNVSTRDISFKYGPIFDKAVVTHDLSCYPFGYIGHAINNPNDKLFL